MLRLNDIIFEFQSALQPDNKEFGDFLAKHGDAVKDIAFNCEDVDALFEKGKDINNRLFLEDKIESKYLIILLLEARFNLIQNIYNRYSKFFILLT